MNRHKIVRESLAQGAEDDEGRTNTWTIPQNNNITSQAREDQRTKNK